MVLRSPLERAGSPGQHEGIFSPMKTDRLEGDVNPVDLLDFFRANKDKLHSPFWLARAIAPQCRNLRRGWAGGSLHMGQDPGEFAQWLIFLSRQNCKSYLEIGCWAGASLFMVDSFLRATVPGFTRSVGVDITTKRLRKWDDYKARYPETEFRICNSENLDLGSERFDAAFIDADHSEAAVLRDYERVRNNTEIIGFHDILLPVSTVGPAWEKIKAGKRSIEFVTCTERERWMKGIGVLIP
jgi:SAM-dependent methyltransferase